MITTADFFDHIHPEIGWLCLFTLPDRRHYWFQDVDKMAEAALRLDAEGKAVFHACASFSRKERKQEYVERVSCAWFDIDAGIGKPYETPGRAYGALEEWRTKHEWPVPTVALSGGGIHAYWTFERSLDLTEWQSVAANLRALAVHEGLAIDPGSTIDAARVLRPPGTHNRKLFDATGKKIADVGGEPRLVKCGPLVGPYTEEELNVLFLDGGGVGSSGGSVAVFSLGNIPAYLKESKAEALPHADTRASDPHAIAQRCAQVRRLRDSPGNVSEPDWYAVLGVLGHCEDAGDSFAKSLATSPEWISTIEKKLTHYRSSGAGPTTCARFQVLNGIGCVGCQYDGKITSPIQLGRDLPVVVQAAAPGIGDLPAIPKPYVWRGTQLAMERKADEKDASTLHILSPYPVYVSELQETERSGDVSAVVRSWEPMKNDWRAFSIELSKALGMQGKSQFAAKSVAIPDKRWKQFADYVVASTNVLKGTKNYGVRYDQFGWKISNDSERTFCFGRSVLRPFKTPYIAHGSDEVDRRGCLMDAAGSVEAWSGALTRLLEPLTDAHRFLFMCGFAATLYHFTGAVGATFVHVMSTTTGNAKTTIMNAIQTAFGAEEATSINARDTQVAKFITLGVLNNLPIFFDELRFPEAEETKDYVLLGTLGRDKQRGKVDGGLRSDHLSWSTIHISASNLSLIDTVQHDGSETAQAARIFEFPLRLPAGLKTSDGDALMAVLRANRGTAGRVFIQYVVDHHDDVKQTVIDRMKHYEERLGAGPESRFAIRLLACVSAAAGIARDSGVVVVDAASMLDWACGHYADVSARLTADAAQEPSAIISDMMNDLLPGTLIVDGSGMPREPRMELVGRHDKRTGEWLFSKKAVRKWMQKNHYPMTEIGKAVKESGLATSLGVRLSLGKSWRTNGGTAWCWQINGNHPSIAEAVEQGDGVVVPFAKKVN